MPYTRSRLDVRAVEREAAKQNRFGSTVVRPYLQKDADANIKSFISANATPFGGDGVPIGRH